MTSVQIPHSVAAALPTLSVFDITNEVTRDVAAGPARRGIAYVTAAVPTSLVRVSERESGFFCDIEALFENLVPRAGVDRERMLLALLGPRTEQIPFEGGRLCLGQWQRVLLFCIDGFETNDWSGRVFVPNPAAASEVSIELGNGPGEAPANGVYVNFVPRDGGNLFHGSLFGTYTGPGFQSEPELSDVMVSRGLTRADLGKVIRIWDANGSLGGPIKRDRIWFHQALRSWGSANAVVGVAGDTSTSTLL